MTVEAFKARAHATRLRLNHLFKPAIDSGNQQPFTEARVLEFVAREEGHANFAAAKSQLENGAKAPRSKTFEELRLAFPNVQAVAFDEVLAGVRKCLTAQAGSMVGMPAYVRNFLLLGVAGTKVVVRDFAAWNGIDELFGNRILLLEKENPHHAMFFAAVEVMPEDWSGNLNKRATLLASLLSEEVNAKMRRVLSHALEARAHILSGLRIPKEDPSSRLVTHVVLEESHAQMGQHERFMVLGERAGYAICMSTPTRMYATPGAEVNTIALCVIRCASLPRFVYRNLTPVPRPMGLWFAWESAEGHGSHMDDQFPGYCFMESGPSSWNEIDRWDIVFQKGDGALGRLARLEGGLGADDSFVQDVSRVEADREEEFVRAVGRLCARPDRD